MESKQYLVEFQAGRRERMAGYQYFVPNPINRQWRWKDAQLNTLLEKASRPDKQVVATETVLQQTELFTEDWVKATIESHTV